MSESKKTPKSPGGIPIHPKALAAAKRLSNKPGKGTTCSISFGNGEECDCNDPEEIAGKAADFVAGLFRRGGGGSS